MDISRSTQSVAFLALLGALALAGMLVILLPFAGPIIMGGAMAITAYPVYHSMGRRWPRLSPTARSLLLNLVILTLFVLPVVYLIRTAAGQVNSVLSLVARWLQAGQGMRGLDRLAEWVAHAVAQLLQSAFSLLLCPLITFFLLRDGPMYMERLNQFLPLHAEDRQRLFDRTRLATVAIMHGLFLTALLLSVVSTLGYALMGIPSAVLLGVMTGFASAIPVVGTGAVWVPVGLVTILSGRVIPGVLVLAWGTGMCLWVDSVARPWLVGHRIHMGLLPLMFGILGGVSVFGLKGLLIGPLIVSIAPTVFEIVRRRVFALEKNRPLKEAIVWTMQG